MEKLVYLLYAKPGQSAAELRDALFAAAPKLRNGGARGLEVSAADEAVAAGKRIRISRGSEVREGLVSFWIEQNQDRGPCEELLAETCGKLHGYLVVESRPIVNTTQKAKPGERVPGFHLCTAIRKSDELSYERFIQLWYDEQRACASETQDTFAYIRNEVVRAVTPDAPDFHAIVEEGFPIEALDDPYVFYDAVGDEERFKRHTKRMAETCVKFLDMSATDSHPMSRYELDGRHDD